MDNLVLTPSECVALINQTMEVAYPTVLLEGEVSSFKISRDKYVFFDVKDQEVSLSCFMMLWRLTTPLEDGMRVKLLAEPRLTKWGKFSLNVRKVVPVGRGNIKIALEQLKQKLQLEGLLDEERKRPLPKFPKKIGVIGSVESAGYGDFIKILDSRWRAIDIEVANVQVQGISAIEQNINAINYMQQFGESLDILIIIRGGGSIDDLAVYNDEQLARTIAASRIPTVVGVGHEVDTSLADLVADVRAATPSNAAQIISPDGSNVLRGIGSLKTLLDRESNNLISNYKMQIDYGIKSIENSINLNSTKQSLNDIIYRLNNQGDKEIANLSQKIASLKRTLRQLDPEVVIKRGYAVVKSNDKIVVSGKEISKGDILQIELKDVNIESEVKNATKK